MNWSLQDVIGFVEACYDRDAILDVLMGYGSQWFRQRMVLIVGRAWVQLFATAALDLPEEIPRSARRAEVADDAPAITNATSTGLASETGLGQLFEQLDLGDPNLKTIGVTIGSRIAIVLVGVIDGDETVDASSLETAADAAGRQLEDVIRMAKADELPPAEERIPPYPEPRTGGYGPGSDSTEKDGRQTQRLEEVSGLDEESDEDASGAPRLALNIPRPDSSDELDPSHTSFGLPFSEGSEAPGRPADSAVSEPSSVSEAEASEPSEGESSSAASEADDDGTMIGAPKVEERFPGDIGMDPIVLDEEPSDSEALELGSMESGVRVVSPTELDAGDSGRTQLGGIGAIALNETKGDDASDKPSTKADPKRTQLGGVGGEQDIVADTIERKEAEDAVAAASDVLAADGSGENAARGSKEDSKGAWMNARTSEGVPAAMILKPAKRRRKKAGSGRTDTSAEPKKGAPEKEGSKKEASRKEASEKEASKKEASKKEELDVNRRPTRVSTDPLSEASVGMEERSKGTQIAPPNRTSFGSPFSQAEEGETRKFDKDGDVDDTWFDYFADSAEDESPDSHAALNFSLSEPSDDPHSIPPETLERLLDSGPEMVDMQEQFMILDSRDQDKAFAAADKVARLGERAIEVLDLMFPGRVFLDRYQFADDLPPVDQHGPVLHALVRLGDMSLPVASRHLTESSNEARFYAVYLLTKLDAEPVLPDLFDRLFDRDQQIRRIAADIVLQYQSSEMFDDDVLEKIRSELQSDDDVHVTVASSMLAKLRDVNSIELLIESMNDASTPRVKVAILNALTDITLHQWSSPYEWRQWWNKAKKQSREEWIVEALDASVAELRQKAYEEVQRIPGLELNYHPDQPSKLRKRAQRSLQSFYDEAGS